MQKVLFSLLLCVYSVSGAAQSIWADAEGKTPPQGSRYIIPEKSRTLTANNDALKALLSSAAKGAAVELEIPLPNGKFGRFRVRETSVMEAPLQAKYPEIRCYTGYGIDDPTARLKCDFTPWGFHGMILSANSDAVYIDPYTHAPTDFYTVYYKKDYRRASDEPALACHTETEEWNEIKKENASEVEFQGDCTLRTYRLALACTGEYATFHGGTKPLVLAAMNTTMNRVNGVYENDFAVTMKLVAKNDTLIFLNASTDPYTNVSNSATLSTNNTTCNQRIGSANYDIGHVVSTGGGGIAGLGVVCGNGKGRGTTGLASPIGDPFDIDYVSHEMGHQFGGNHCFNNACGGARVDAAAMEPGSGSTIMAYAGICDPNVQNNSDDYFHAVNLQEMHAFITTGGGNTCPVKTPSGNNAPTVNAGPDYIIPVSTPFALTAAGADIDGDTLTYCWEQMDPTPASMPPKATNAAGPMFRSFKPVASPTRIFPRLQDLNANVNPTWEELPGVARSMKFRVTARDNNWNAGCTAIDNMVVTVEGTAGPFAVTAPNTNVVWKVGETANITWDVKNTDIAPVNCKQVKITLSTDGGLTYPTVLWASTPNDGSVQVVVPNKISNTCRVRVEAVGNIFFDISNVNFRIQAPDAPTFMMTASVDQLNYCTNQSVDFSAQLESLLGFSTSVNLTLAGAPAGAAVNISPNPAQPDQSVAVSITGITIAMAGNYVLTLTGTADGVTRTQDVALTLSPSSLDAPALNTPSDGALMISSTKAPLSWTNTSFANNYLVEVASNPSFGQGTVVFSQTLPENNVKVSGLQAGKVYYWRVKALNNCGESTYSPVFAFQTEGKQCNRVFQAGNLPITIPDNAEATLESFISVPTPGIITDLNVALKINHTWIGDLYAELTAPSGQTMQLFDRPGVPADQYGCDGDNINVVFDEEALLSAADFEARCEPSDPAIGGNFRAVSTLTAVNAQSSEGQWKLTVSDFFDADGGAIEAWSLEFCFDGSVGQGALLKNKTLLCGRGMSGSIDSSYLAMLLSGQPSEGKFILLSLPQNGTMAVNGLPLGLGGTFTQAEVNAGLVSYFHNGDANAADSFRFDVFDENNDAWVYNSTFQINILENDLKASVNLVQGLSCFNGNDASILGSATGLDGNYQYSLNGGPLQNSGAFNNLGPGVYTLVVSGMLGFTAGASITIDNPEEIVLSSNVTSDILTVNATGGTGTLEYSLDGMNFQSSNIFSDLANGAYTLTVRDSKGCSKTQQIIIAVNTLIAVLNIDKEVSCAGYNNGQISVNVAGGQPPYSFSLNGAPFQGASIFDNLIAGDYNVTVKDGQNLEVVTNTVNLTNPIPVSAVATANLNVISVAASGGAGGYSYSLDGTNFQPSDAFTVNANGTYTVVVTDEKGCLTLTEVTVAVPPVKIINVDVVNNTCFGDENGVITAIAADGIAPLEYSLNGGAWQTGNQFDKLAGGLYSLTVRDQWGTTATVDVSVLVPAPIDIVVTVIGNDASFTVAGAIPPIIVAVDGVPGAPLNDLPNGLHTLSITNSNNCSAEVKFEVNYTPLSVGAEITSSNLCGGSAMVTLEGNGGVSPYEYAIEGGSYQTSPVFNNLANGNYTFLIRDAQGIVASTNLSISTPPILGLSAAVDTNSITATASGGTPPYSYSINNGQTYQPSNLFTNVSKGTYTLIVKDNFNCTATVSVTVTFSGWVDPSAAWGIQVSPNPGAGIFLIQANENISELHFELFNPEGRMLDAAVERLTGSEGRLSLEQAPAGIYYLRISDSRQSGVIRLAVQR